PHDRRATAQQSPVSRPLRSPPAKCATMSPVCGKTVTARSLEMMMSEQRQVVPVIIVGAGAAGLATAACLKRARVPGVILEAGDDIATTWSSLYDRLHLHTVKQLSGLPGYRMSDRAPRYLSRDEMVTYLHEYARHFDLRIETGERVTRAFRRDGLWALE